MEIFMTNISFSARESQIVTEISKVVHHNPAFTRFNVESPVNFKVFLHHPKKGPAIGLKSSFRTGTVTFATEDVGRQFLALCGGKNARFQISTGHQPITFQQSKFAPKKHVVDELLKVPFRDPRILVKREEKAKLLESTLVHVSEIQFGWECRDGVFSVEYSRRTRGDIHFSRERREFEVSLGSEDGFNENVVISFSQIQRISTTHSSSEVSVLFSLSHAPRFETGYTFPGLEALLSILRTSAPARSRITSLDESHRPLVPYVSNAFRIIFAPAQYDRFHDLWVVSEVNLSILQTDYREEYRAIFSLKALRDVDQWLKELKWPLSFHVNALLRNSVLDPRELLEIRREIERLLCDEEEDYCTAFLRFFREQLRNLWFFEGSQSQESVKDCFKRCRSTFKHTPLPMADDLFHSLHVYVTPTCLFLDGPYPEQTNRIIRKYPSNKDHFLRVAFVDEDHLKFRFDNNVDGRSFINSHIGNILRTGLTVGGRRFEFLHYSQSALKDHAVWFILPFVDPLTKRRVDAQSIIDDLGTFTDLPFDKRLIYCPARYAARLSQAFTTTDSSISIDPGEIAIEDDIKGSSGSCFTDGVGTVSRVLADEMWKLLCSKRRRGFRSPDHPQPRAFQIRFRGSKGMISVDHTLQGRVLVLRPSMIKFEAAEREIEIASVFNKPGKMFLNRPLIMLLEGLGVPGEVFLGLQRKAVKRILDATKSLDNTSTVLDSYGLGQSFRLASTMRHLANLRPACTPTDTFYAKSIQNIIFHILRDLKHRARIPVPGWTLVGVADVHSFLEEGEVFVCIEERRGCRKFLEGPVCISRSPTIHPGDVQIARAIGAPPPGSPFSEEVLQNTLVFSTKGRRSLPSCLGGGDLDGDLYNVTDHRDLLPQNLYLPAAYDPAQRKEVDHPSGRDDVIDFIVDYINADNVGIIATNWLILADQSDLGIHDKNCLLLAKLHSDAVDYPKSGNAVPMRQIPRVGRSKPDWAEPETGQTSPLDDIDYYPSQRAIGKLYRDINISDAYLDSMFEDFGLNALTGVFGRYSDAKTTSHIVNDPLWQAVTSEVYRLTDDLNYSGSPPDSIDGVFQTYCQQLRCICSTYALSNKRRSRLTESEAFIGTIRARTSQRKKRTDLISKLREHTSQLVTDVKHELAGGDSENISRLDRLRMAWAAWQLSINGINRRKFGASSFFWVALSSLFDAIRSLKDETEEK